MGILNLVVLDATEKLKAIGFKKRSGEVYTYEPTKGFLGWLGLNHARRGSAVEINPVVGVRSQELEKLLASLLGEKLHSYIPPTISVSLGYLMPEKCYRAWLFENEDDLQRVAELVKAIREFACPFINSSASLEALEQSLKSPEYAHAEHAMYRLPLVRLMLNDKRGTLELCQHYMAGLTNRGDIAAERYRRFAKAVTGLLK